MDTFYNNRKLDIITKLSILEYAFNNSLRYHIDILDCKKSPMRKRIDMSYDEVITKLDNRCIFSVVYRELQGIGEISFCTMRDPEYFLFIDMELMEFNKLIEKFNLTKR